MSRVLVLSVAHDVADARLHRLCLSFAEAGADIRLRGLGDVADGPRGVTCETWHRANRVRRLIRSVTAPWRHRTDMLVVVDPDLFPMALVARRLGWVKTLVCDVHEDYVHVVEDRDWGSHIRRRAALVVARTGIHAASRADWTIVADDHVPPMSANRRRVVRNLPTLRHDVDLNQAAELRAVYVGDVRASRGAFEMVEGVLASAPWELDIVGPINQVEDRERLVDMIAGSDRVRLWGRQGPERSWEIARGATVGLSMLQDTPAFRAALPSKVFQYLNEGMAIVSTPLARIREIVATHDVGAVVTDATGLAAQLGQWSAEPERLERCRSNARTWARASLSDVDEFDAVIGEISATGLVG